MGSQSRLLFRNTDGQVYRTSESASGISWFVNNMRLVNKDAKHIERFLAEYNFDGQSTPQGAGLVVVDMMENTILDYQDVTGVGFLEGILIAADARDLIQISSGDPTLAEHIELAYQVVQEGTKETEGADEYKCVRFREFLEAGRGSIGTRGRDKSEISDYQIKGKSLYQIHQDLSSLEKPIRCNLNMDPFEVIIYKSHTLEGAREMQQKMGELGFQFSADELKDWNTWKRHYCREE